MLYWTRKKKTPGVLLELRDQLREVLETDDSQVDKLVKVYDLVSRVQDSLISEGLDLNELVLEKIHALGREPYGQNRTVPGQTVSEENVFLGNVYGVWSISVAEIHRRTLDSQVLRILERQADGMLDHARELVQLIK